MTLPIISGYAAAILGFLQIGLMVTVGNARRDVEVSLGDGGNAELLMKIRRHGNLTENAPLFLILLSFLEVTGGPMMVVLTLASIFITARLSHAFALSGPNKPVAARAGGALGTVIGIVGTAGILLWHLSTLS